MNSINKSTVIISIIVLFTIAGVAVCLAMYSDEIVKKDNKTKIIQEDCEHDWVVTSKYILLIDNYKTISKCSKCGKEIE